MPFQRARRTWGQVRAYRAPGLFMLLAPASVIAALVLFENVLIAFLAYHVLVCMLLPALYERYGKVGGWREVAHEFGLRGMRDRGAWLAGAGVGSLMFLGMLVPYALVGHRFVDAANVTASLGAWGLHPEEAWWLFAYMLVFNSGAEELFWRGYIHERLASLAPRWLALALASAAFASYHWFTVHQLLGNALIATGALLGVFAGGLIWAVLRERYGTVLPALLAHGGATLGYMTIYIIYLV